MTSAVKAVPKLLLLTASKSFVASWTHDCLHRLGTRSVPTQTGHLVAQLRSSLIHFIQNPTVWGAEPVVTHQTSWLESTGKCGVRQNQAAGSLQLWHNSEAIVA